MGAVSWDWVKKYSPIKDSQPRGGDISLISRGYKMDTVLPSGSIFAPKDVYS